MRFSPRSHPWGWVGILCAGLALAAFGLAEYWIVDGSRALKRELDALRASGRPEFPEQIAFVSNPMGEDPVAWWKAFEEASTPWTLAQLPDCASRVAAGEDEEEIIEDCEAALMDPRRLESLKPCEIAVLRARVEGDQRAQELC